MSLPDYSEYLKRPDKLNTEEYNWLAHPGVHDEYARVVNEVIKKYKIVSVIEVGCGTGEVAKRLSVNVIGYAGIDANPECIKIAKEKNKEHGYKIFGNYDIRDGEILNGHQKNNLVLAFAFLKHFGLHEWGEIFNKLASLGDYLIFSMQIAETTKDDGIDFHHVWLTLEDLKKYIADAGFKILDIKQNPHVPLEPIFICKKKSQESEEKKEKTKWYDSPFFDYV